MYSNVSVSLPAGRTGIKALLTMLTVELKIVQRGGCPSDQLHVCPLPELHIHVYVGASQLVPLRTLRMCHSSHDPKITRNVFTNIAVINKCLHVLFKTWSEQRAAIIGAELN